MKKKLLVIICFAVAITGIAAKKKRPTLDERLTFLENHILYLTNRITELEKINGITQFGSFPLWQDKAFLPSFPIPSKKGTVPEKGQSPFSFCNPLLYPPFVKGGVGGIL